MTPNADLAEVLLRQLPPSRNETDEQALAIAEAQVRATLAVAEALTLIEAELTYLRKTLDPDRGL
jgi:hypothetical protein